VVVIGGDSSVQHLLSKVLGNLSLFLMECLVEREEFTDKPANQGRPRETFQDGLAIVAESRKDRLQTVR
jgi:hypothetical protein